VVKNDFPYSPYMPEEEEEEEEEEGGGGGGGGGLSIYLYFRAVQKKIQPCVSYRGEVVSKK
jgi:hypothetical protein